MSSVIQHQVQIVKILDTSISDRGRTAEQWLHTMQNVRGSIEGSGSGLGLAATDGWCPSLESCAGFSIFSDACSFTESETVHDDGALPSFLPSFPSPGKYIISDNSELEPHQGMTM